MSKKGRLFIILLVLAMCFVFLWPSICWYARTPKDDKALALSSLEKIKEYATFMAENDVEQLRQAAKASDAEIPAGSDWLVKAAKKNFKDMGKEVPSPLTLRAALETFSREELTHLIEDRYRSKILKDKNNYKNSVKLGLDLSGGMNVIVKADLDAVVNAQKEAGAAAGAEKESGEDEKSSTNAPVVAVNETVLRNNAMAQAIETLTSRIDRFGLSSPTIRQQGEDHIYIELPGSAETDQINSIIQGRGILNFRLADMDATEKFLQYYFANRNNTFDSKGNLIDPSVIPEDCEVFGFYVTDEYGLDQKLSSRPYLVVKKQIALEGKHIKSAEVGQDNLTGRPQVNFTLDSEGASIFAKFTAEHKGEYLSIVSDNKIKSNARINSEIPGGQVAIDGFGMEEAHNLQKVLQTAWLEVPLSVESQQVIGAELGSHYIRQGLIAIVVGLALIMLFMLVFYKGAGVNACVAQILNLYIMFSIMSALNFTVTRPSIAGMILTIGMAVDANVIIFERIKEERALGKDRASSIAVGFANAFWSIMDSNITTFIAAVFMTQLGSGSIQGFAYSLAIGVCSTVFTALVVSRLMFDFNTEVVGKKNISISWRMK
ncbi:MAG: protein translocase subunit SecD [Treponema sp.]|nr:protein translocase subunit SecD [Treponema sp.]